MVFCGVVYDYYGIVILKLKLKDEIIFEIVEVINNIMVGVVFGMLFLRGKVKIFFLRKKIDFVR